MDTQWIAPAALALLGAATTITAAVLGIRGNRNQARENRAPDVTDSWAQTDRARDLYWALREWFYRLRTAFRAYVTRVQGVGSTDLTPEEQAVFTYEPSTTPTPMKEQK